MLKTLRQTTSRILGGAGDDFVSAIVNPSPGFGGRVGLTGASHSPFPNSLELLSFTS